MEIDEENYVGSFKPEMMDVVFAWAKGASFSQICKMTDIFEGRLAFLTVFGPLRARTGYVHFAYDPFDTETTYICKLFLC